MELAVIDDIVIEIDEAKIADRLRINKYKGFIGRFQPLLEETKHVVRPKGVYRPVDFDAIDDDVIIIDGIRLTSQILAIQLVAVHRVFPFVVTCGREVVEWAAKKTSMLERFWIETILDEFLIGAIGFVSEHIVTSHGLGKTAVMTPGSIDDWPIQEQKPLFAILGDVEAAIGVRLRNSLVMDPLQSISGILFCTEFDFQTCMLCPRENCPKRRASYDLALYEERFRKK